MKCALICLLLAPPLVGGCSGSAEQTSSNLTATASTGTGGSTTGSSSGTAGTSGGTTGTMVTAAKMPIVGLVSMGSQSFGETELPTNDMEEIKAHPGVYKAAVINVYWSQLEPSQGVFDDSAIDSALANISSYNASYPTTPVAGKLRVHMGAGTPSWVLSQLGAITLSSSSGTLQVGPYWTPAYAALWQALQQHLATRYDAGTAIAEVAISSCSSITAEPFIEALDATSLANLHAAGYSDALDQAALANAPADYAAWTSTPLDYTFNTFRNSDTGTLVNNPGFTVQEMAAFRAAMGTRGVVANHGLEDPLTSAALPVYAELTALYDQARAAPPPTDSPLEFQTYGPNVDWDSAIALGMTYHPTEIEIWDTVSAGGSAPLTQSQLAGWAAMLTSQP